MPAAFPQFVAPFRAFLDKIPPTGRVVVFCHFDADGLGAGAVFGRGLQRINAEWQVEVLPSGKGENAFLTPSVREKLLALKPDALIVTDLGVHAHGTLEADGVPVLYVDHHIPEGYPPVGSTMLTGYGLDPVPCSAWLAYELIAAEVEINDLQWVAAIGIISDLGDSAPWPPLAQTKKQYTAKWLKEAVALCNAARRAGEFDLDRPLQHLMADDNPRPLAQDTVLAEYRAEVSAALQAARRLPPRFPKASPDAAPVALITLDSPCQIHPLIAQQWIQRLPDRVVLCANLGYLPDGQIAVAGRTANRGLHIPDLLRAAFARTGAVPPTNFAHGHPQASGGHLSAADFEHLLRGLGYEV
ncbi:DHH family phosphoesterase [Hymenobacter sp. GOD-10R]|uniref:DHH family phosphoesterase n=1 Tax=Hymenobacter sp. GOD-10R TaxID=3093922 RepID=UPI002D79FFC7|nr:DHH family phosphoesterase [Hymenobacter sp. GOD-10R]WRQ28624.1 DHH family phosphoesterase [Hymenobacter sp. GOD-10R]